MRRSGKWIGRDIIVRMTQRIGQEEHQYGEEYQRQAQCPAILCSIIGMERNRILRALDVDASRIVGTGDVKRPNVHDDHAGDHERQ